jgi:chromosomal replication initiation ATPase DnaA
LSAEDLLAVTRRSNEGREVAMWALRQDCRMRLGEIADKMGVGYSAVAHGVIKVRRRIKANAAYGERIQTAIFNLTLMF